MNPLDEMPARDPAPDHPCPVCNASAGERCVVMLVKGSHPQRMSDAMPVFGQYSGRPIRVHGTVNDARLGTSADPFRDIVERLYKAQRELHCLTGICATIALEVPERYAADLAIALAPEMFRGGDQREFSVAPDVVVRADREDLFGKP